MYICEKWNYIIWKSKFYIGGEYEVDGVIYQKTGNSYLSMPKDLGTRVGIKYYPKIQMI